MSEQPSGPRATSSDVLRLVFAQNYPIHRRAQVSVSGTEDFYQQVNQVVPLKVYTNCPNCKQHLALEVELGNMEAAAY